MAATPTSIKPSAASNNRANADIDKAIAETISSNGRADTWESADHPGLKFRLKKFARSLIRDAVSKMKEPTVPKIHIPEDDRYEDNPNDPDFLRDTQEYQSKISTLTIDMYLTMGTELLGLPQDREGPDSNDWVEQLSAVIEDLVIPENRWARYKYWVRWYALHETEMIDLVRAAQRYNGDVLERDVESASESFKSDEGRGDNNEASEAKVD